MPCHVCCVVSIFKNLCLLAFLATQASSIVLDYGHDFRRRDGNVSAQLQADIDNWAKTNEIQYYQRPNNPKVHEWTALGDSYTAGVGSNGLPDDWDNSKCSRFKQAYPLQMNADWRWGDPNGRTLNFGACTGDKLDDVVNKQLTQNPKKGYQNFGRPQLAVATMSGNDLGFTTVINACVIRFLGLKGPPDCEETLKAAEDYVVSYEFQRKLDDTIEKILMYGQHYTSAEPRNSFQLYLLPYPKLWNQASTDCDSVSFEWFHQSGKHNLNLALRHRFNEIVDQLNSQLRAAVQRHSIWGAFWADGFEWNFDDGHKFCEPIPGSSLSKPITDQTWFWYRSSPWRKGGEGPKPPQNSEHDAQIYNNSILDQNEDIPTLLLNLLVTNKTERDLIINGEKFPGEVNPAFGSEEDLMKALDTADYSVLGDLQTEISLPDRWVRMFHPKGSGYYWFKDPLMNEVIRERPGIDTHLAAETPSSTSQPPPSPTCTKPPKSTKALGDTCQDWYQVTDDDFHIYGKGWDPEKLGQDECGNLNGLGLLDQLRKHAGVITNWQFMLVDDNGDYEWFAGGKTIVGKKSAVGDAVVAAGGSTADGCTGAG